MRGPIVTGLYVPGDRPERFAKAVATGADLVILDLEDAVAAEHKAAARQHVVDWLASAEPKPPVVEVRVNAGVAADLEALAAVTGGVARAAAQGRVARRHRRRPRRPRYATRRSPC